MPGAPPPVPPVSASIFLTQAANWDGESQEVYKALTAAFDAEDYLKCIDNLRARDIEPQLYIDNLDKIIDTLPVDSEFRKRCTRALRKTCGIYGILPACYEVTPAITMPPGQIPVSRGGFADVWRLTDEKDGSKVFAVKSLRVYQEDPVEKINKQYCKEVIVCKLAKHPNIMPIDGVARKLSKFCIVSQWMENGNMLKYLVTRPGANRLHLLVGVTHGLSYLHSNEIIHGDLKGENILIDMEGSPRLTDFGRCSITKNTNSVHVSTPNSGCTVRHCAPELLDAEGIVSAEKRRPTNKSDVYSLSMVIVELATGKAPYPGFSDHTVVIMVSKGKRPPKPRPFEAPGLTPAVWKIAKKCWSEKAKDRPEIDAVIQYLGGIATTGDKQAPSRLRQRFRGMFSN